jgi:hypothetical protein
MAALLIFTASRVAHGQVCIGIDEARDTLSQSDRSAALLLLARQFESQGQRVVTDACAEPYVVSHVKFGETIIITLVGPAGQREAMALNMADVPAVYSQLVRAILTGLPVGSMRGVVDRTNVTVTQAEPLRVSRTLVATTILAATLPAHGSDLARSVTRIAPQTRRLTSAAASAGEP